MQLYSIRGGSKEDLENKEYNIGVGISLGNKWFTIDNIINTIGWSLQYTREYIIVYVADDIHAINLAVRNQISKERALRLARRRGKEILAGVSAKVAEIFSRKEAKKIFFAHWEDLVDENYLSKKKYLYSLYENDMDFRNKIHDLIRGFVSGEKKKFSETEIHNLGMYIIEELPEIMCRVPIKGMSYEAYAYPFDGELLKFVEEMQLGSSFPQIRNEILDTQPKVFLEVR